MPWIGIADSGLDFTFTPTGGTTMVGSEVLATAEELTAFELGFISEPVAPPLARVTVQSYEAGSPFGEVGGAEFILDSENGQLFFTNAEPAGNPQEAFTPAQFQGDCRTLSYNGSFGNEWSGVETFSFLIEVEADAPVVESCEELGRVTRAYVSGYQRDRVHRSTLVRGERRCLVANFNGAIPPARSIVSATWRTNQNQCIAMNSARIDGRDVTVDIAAQLGSGAEIKCEATLDNGEVYNQLFVIRVLSSPWFQGEGNPGNGPQSLTVTA